MKREEKGTSISKLVLCCIATFILISLMTSIGGCFAMKDDKDSISELSFSHDGKKVVFDRCRNEGCQIQVYDLETGELAAYQSPKGGRWTMGKYAFDGMRIAFSVIPIKPNGGLELSEMQIAVMDADGKNFRKVTTGPGAKLYPVFSHSGKKILYARAAYIRTEGRTPAAQYDAWEIDLETGGQKQLTFFKYYYMGYLAYYPDDERFIYYGELPEEFPGEKYGYGNDFKKNMAALARKGMGIHGVVVMKGKELIPKPYSIDANIQPQKPLLNKDASLLLYEKSDTGDYYLYSPDGNHRLVGSGGSVDVAALSPDGELLAMIAVGKTMDVFTARNGKRKQILYLPCVPKIIENWPKDMRREAERLHTEFKMIPEKPLRTLNLLNQ